jgi:hypothetical protein
MLQRQRAAGRQDGLASIISAAGGLSESAIIAVIDAAKDRLARDIRQGRIEGGGPKSMEALGDVLRRYAWELAHMGYGRGSAEGVSVGLDWATARVARVTVQLPPVSFGVAVALER